jgi:hypothetical protein
MVEPRNEKHVAGGKLRENAAKLRAVGACAAVTSSRERFTDSSLLLAAAQQSCQ